MPTAHGAPFTTYASDGYPISGFVWRQAHPPASPPEQIMARASVIICAATSVRCRYYFRFAQYLYELGRDVVVFDYRGIGESRPARMRGFNANWRHWGERDFDAVLRYTLSAFENQPVDVVAHSFGGCAAGLAAQGHCIRRMVTVGAQFAYWRDYAAHKRLRMLLKWHVLMPVLTAALGYFPGRRLGWLEDTPAGVVRDWTAPAASFGALPSMRLGARDVETGFARLKMALLAISLTDDEYGTPAAIARLLSLHTGARSTHLRVAPADLGLTEVGHFAFFHARHQPDLWPIAAHWLAHAALPGDVPGQMLPTAQG
ncbi:MAG: alpha/beta fold hydrolase [Comamonadaceae bacterium]|nr:MAG: alpha/beta fold hydrolase [Comamonadaceae bacterium]